MGCIACCVDTNTYNLLSGSPQPPVFTLTETEYNIFETCGSLSALVPFLPFSNSSFWRLSWRVAKTLLTKTKK